MKIYWSHVAVMNGRMMLGELICQVVGTFVPEDDELYLFNAVLYPIKSHVGGFGTALLDIFIGDASGCRVVGDDHCQWLLVGHFFENNA